MTKKRFFLTLGCVLAGGLFIVATGCETDSASDLSVNISPSGGVLKPGQSVKLTASGGWNYQWVVEDDDLGYLSSKTGSSVIYTAFSSSSNATHKITVTGFGSGSGGSTNNTSFAASSSASAVFKSK